MSCGAEFPQTKQRDKKDQSARENSDGRFFIPCGQSSRASIRKLTGRKPSLQEIIAERGFFIQPP